MSAPAVTPPPSSPLDAAICNYVGERLFEFLDERGYACPNIEALGAAALEAAAEAGHKFLGLPTTTAVGG